MTSEHEHWTDRLSEYLDGDVGPEDRGAVEAHLEGCPRCRTVLEELRAVADGAAALPDLPPARDLWPGIEARLAPRSASPAAVMTDDVIPIRRRRVAMTVPQLVAAGIALVLFSAGGVWMAVAGGAPGGAATVATSATADPVGDAGAVPVAFTAAYDEVIRELETEYRSRRTELDPETIRVVERNLEIIDRAIEDARRALEADPSSGFLSAHLAEAMRRKTDLLRRAATIETTEI